MKKTLQIITLLLAVLASPVAAQVAMTHVVASYYTEASDATGGSENYYLVVADKSNAVYNVTEGSIQATNANVAAIDFYAPSGTGKDLPSGVYKAGTGSLYYDADYSYTTKYDMAGKAGKENALKGDVTVTKNSDDTYTVVFNDANGIEYTYTGTLSFVDMNSSTSVYPQIPNDINTTFTGGMAYYHGNLMESNTGNIYINLYDCAFDAETGNMQGTGYDLAICAFNRLFGDP